MLQFSVYYVISKIQQRTFSCSGSFLFITLKELILLNFLFQEQGGMDYIKRIMKFNMECYNSRTL
jgi:hypothetical protein